MSSKNRVIADTSFVVAVAIKTDNRHKDCVELFKRYDRIYLPQSALAEVAFMLTRAGGKQATAHFFRWLHLKYDPVPLIAEDFSRTADLLEKYNDSRIDFVDATVAAIAERLNINLILTLDQRDFHLLRPNHIEHFQLLP